MGRQSAVSRGAAAPTLLSQYRRGQRDFHGWDLASASLRYSLLGEILLTDADLHDADLEGADLHSADLSHAHLNRANLVGANLHDANLHKANLVGAVLTRARLSGAVLQAANLTRADLRGADLRGADLRDAILDETLLQAADLRRTDLRGAHLTNTHLERTNLADTDLSETLLHRVHLSGALLGASRAGAESEEVDNQATDVDTDPFSHCMLVSGTAHPALASAVAQILGVRLGASHIERFPDGELSIHLEEPVRGRNVFLIQPTVPPVNDHVMELLIASDACRRAAAARLIAVIPYFGYARADKRQGQRVPIAASLVAHLIESAGIAQVVTVDLHAAQIEGFFSIPVESLTAVPLLSEEVRPLLPANAVVVSPDTGRVRMATEYANRLGTSVVVLHKRRESGTETEVTHVVGDVRGRACLIIDDMISTGGTIARSVEALLQAGAKPEIVVAATHGLFIADARAKLAHESIRAVVVTDTVPVSLSNWPQLHVVSAAPLLAEAIRRLAANGSLSTLRRGSE